jgi:hypothetical protein
VCEHDLVQIDFQNGFEKMGSYGDYPMPIRIDFAKVQELPEGRKHIKKVFDTAQVFKRFKAIGGLEECRDTATICAGTYHYALNQEKPDLLIENYFITGHNLGARLRANPELWSSASGLFVFLVVHSKPAEIVERSKLLQDKAFHFGMTFEVLWQAMLHADSDLQKYDAQMQYWLGNPLHAWKPENEPAS